MCRQMERFALSLFPYSTLSTSYLQTHDIVLGPETAQDFNTQFHRYHNTIIGRYSNRLPVGEHKLERNGITSVVKIESNGMYPGSAESALSDSLLS